MAISSTPKMRAASAAEIASSERKAITSSPTFDREEEEPAIPCWNGQASISTSDKYEPLPDWKRTGPSPATDSPGSRQGYDFGGH